MAYGKSRLTRPEVARLELMPPTNDVHDLLRHTQHQLKRVANHCVVSWLTHHEQAQSLMRLEAGLPVHPCPPQLCARWLRECQALCPDVQSATVLAVTNWLAQTYTQQKSPKSNCKRWLQVLRREESHWSYQSEIPVRLWNGNAKFVRAHGGVAVQIRVDRFDKPGCKVAGSTPHQLHILRPKDGKRSDAHRAAYLAACEIADGKRKLSQSQISYDERLRKWFLFLTIEGAVPENSAWRDETKVIFFRPGRHDAIRIHADSISGGFGDESLDRVAAVRAKLDEWRASYRAEHGAAPLPRTHADGLLAKWRRHSGSICDSIAAEVVRSLKGRDFGRVVWLDGNNRRAALAVAGKDGDADPRELFPFELLRRKIEKRLGDIGIECEGRANFRSVKRRKQERQKKLVRIG